MAQKLAHQQIEKKLTLISWKLNKKGEIYRTFQVKDFPHALLLVNSVGLFAEYLKHHPDILIRYNKVTFRLITHDAGGLTQSDFDLAEKINKLASPRN